MIEPAPAAVQVPVTELAGTDVEGLGGREVHRPLDPVTGPVLRIAAGRRSPTEHVLVLVVHHIVADGWSVRILADELTALYRAETGGPPAALPARRSSPPTMPHGSGPGSTATLSTAASTTGALAWPTCPSSSCPPTGRGPRGPPVPVR